MTNAPVSFPLFADKHRGTPLVTPAMMSAMLTGSAPDDELVVPENIILGYSSRLAGLLADRGFTRVTGYPSPYRAMWLRRDDPGARVGVVEGFGYGAPAATMTLEELIARGARRVITLGIAGALASGVDFADVVVCSAALRDEGVSHHYLPAARYAHPSPSLTRALVDELDATGEAFHVGPSWTIDAIYRETLEEATAYRDEGVVTVEMEASALFAVGQYRGVEVAALFTISDHLLAHDQWRVAPDRRRVSRALAAILDTAIDVLSRLADASEGGA